MNLHIPGIVESGAVGRGQDLKLMSTSVIN